MKINKWYGLSIRVIALFVTAMIVSFSPTFFRSFFDDYLYTPDDSSYSRGFFDKEWHWGYRHYLYFWMCVILFIIQAVRLGMWVDKNAKEFKP